MTDRGRPVADTLGNVAAVVLGAAAFLASAIHVFTVCLDAGAGSSTDRPVEAYIVAALITVAVELLAAVSMLELRKGIRWAPATGLLLGVGLTCAANLATTQDNGPGWGWPETVAIAPAVLFLVVLVIVETRPASAPRPAKRSAAKPEPARVTVGQPAKPQVATGQGGQHGAHRAGVATVASMGIPAAKWAVAVQPAADRAVAAEVAERPAMPTAAVVTDDGGRVRCDAGCGQLVSGRSLRRHRTQGCPESKAAAS